MTDYKPYFAIEKKLKSKGFTADRKDLVEQFTNGKKDSLKSLNPWEYKEFIKWLNAFANGETVVNKTDTTDKCQLLRRKVIALFHKMHYKLPDGKINMDRVNEWCSKYGMFHKKLNNHDYHELVKLVTQVEEVYATFLNGLK